MQTLNLSTIFEIKQILESHDLKGHSHYGQRSPIIIKIILAFLNLYHHAKNQLSLSIHS